MKTKSVRELLDLAVQEDDEQLKADALLELRKRQEQSKTRLYPHGRKGANDEGYVVCTQEVEDDQLVWRTTWLATRYGALFDARAAHYWIVEAAKHMLGIVHTQTKGELNAQMRAVHEIQHGADDEQWIVMAGLNDDGKALIVVPDEDHLAWKPGLAGMSRFCSNLIIAIEVGQPKQLSFDLEEWTLIYPFMPDGMFPPPPSSDVQSTMDALTQALRKRKEKSNGRGKG